MEINYAGKQRIDSWQKFLKIVRAGNYDLFCALDNFPDSVLVTGCQRSGTTVLSRIITQSEGMVKYWFGNDDELDAALILSGYVSYKCEGRYCFQTTYMYNNYEEYFKNNNGHKIIWILRNPYSVVCSMLFNWKRFALNELFEGCGIELLDGRDKWLYEKFGAFGVGPTKKASLSYKAKMSELKLLREHYNNNEMIVVDYDELIQNKYEIMPKIYEFIGLRYDESYADKLHSSSIVKYERLSSSQKLMIKSICEPLYIECKSLKSEF